MLLIAQPIPFDECCIIPYIKLLIKISINMGIETDGYHFLKSSDHF